MRTILVPLDFSKYSLDALDYAIELSDKMLANIHVVHVLEYPGFEHFDTFGDGYAGVGMDDVFMLKLIEKSENDLNKIKEKYPKAELETYVKMGTSLKNEIIDFSQKINADLIVMGSKGTNTLDEEIIGSNTEKIVRNAFCPVLTIKEKGNANVKNMVFASDFKDVNEVVIDHVKLFQGIFNAKLHLLRVCTPHNFETSTIIKSRINEVVEKYEFKNYEIHTYNDYYEEDGIENFTSYNNYDMVCLATGGRKGLSNFFTGSIAEDVVNYSKKPVMTFNLKTINGLD